MYFSCFELGARPAEHHQKLRSVLRLRCGLLVLVAAELAVRWFNVLVLLFALSGLGNQLRS
jgi:hypothetical protein